MSNCNNCTRRRNYDGINAPLICSMGRNHKAFAEFGTDCPDYVKEDENQDQEESNDK